MAAHSYLRYADAVLPVPLNEQPKLLAAYLGDKKTGPTLWGYIVLSVAGSVLAAASIAELTPEKDTTSRVRAAVFTGAVVGIANVLLLANRAEKLRQERGGSATWLE